MRERSRHVAAFVGLVAAAGCSTAHFQRIDEPTMSTEPLSIGVPLARNQVFDAQLPLRAFLYNGLDREGALDDGGFAAVLSFTFRLTMRMESTQSTPVLPPSYEPYLTLQLVETLPLGAAGGETVHRLVNALELTARHHSNGQSGCALAGGTLRSGGSSDFDCVWPAGTSRPQALNLDDGSFSTQVLGARVRSRWLAFPGTGGASLGGLTVGVGVDWNVPCRFAGCIDPPMRARYGEAVMTWLGAAELEVIGRRHLFVPKLGPLATDARLRLTASGDAHLGLGAGRRPFGSEAFELAYLAHFDRGGSGGPFVRYSTGRDPLNIRFEQRRDVWSIGWMAELSAPPTLAAR